MAKKDKKREVTCKIHKVYGFLTAKEDKVFVRVSWNDGEARDEVRKCWRDKETDELRLGKGIDLSEEEIDALKSFIKDKPKPVDFNAVFESSVGIMEKRAAGFQTEDGFAVLRRRNGVKL